MRKVFLDTAFFIGLLNPRDQHHAIAETVDKSISGSECDLYTSQMVLAEVLSGLADEGSHIREAATNYVDDLTQAISIAPQTPELFDAALTEYRKYTDKEWGLVDCSSLVIMESEGIHEAATTDHHFKQMGRHILME